MVTDPETTPLRPVRCNGVVPSADWTKPSGKGCGTLAASLPPNILPGQGMKGGVSGCWKVSCRETLMHHGIDRNGRSLAVSARGVQVPPPTRLLTCGKRGSGSSSAEASGPALQPDCNPRSRVGATVTGVRGSVIKRGNSCSVVLDLGRDPATGERRRTWLSGFRTKRDAERARVKLLGELDQGGYVEPATVTVGTFLVERWLPAVAVRLRANTLAMYRQNIGAYRAPLRLHSAPAAHASRPERVLCRAAGRRSQGRQRRSQRADRQDSARDPAAGVERRGAVGAAGAEPGRVRRPAPRPQCRGGGVVTAAGPPVLRAPGR